MWFLRFPDRLDEEMRAVNALVQEGWITNVGWRLAKKDGALCADVSFQAGSKLRQVQLVYPYVYPYAPAQVFPRDDARWSTHQWPSGELCLEIRADNWRTTYTGSDLLKSARYLLNTEAQTDEKGRPRRVLSAHNFTEGQLLSNSFFRLVLHEDLIVELRQRGTGVWQADFRDTLIEMSCLVTAVGLSAPDGSNTWSSHSVPPLFADSPNLWGRIALIETGDELHQALTRKDITSLELWAQFSSDPLRTPCVVIGVLGEKVLARYISFEKVFDVPRLPMDAQKRSPMRNSVLADKRVAIVGCGSMGSKVAASLARSGVGDFVLIDSDVLKDGNLVRHDLDWAAVGAHKVDGLKQRLGNINPRVTTAKWVGQFGRQHSTASLLEGLSLLAECDLIVEVTGSAQGFSYTGAMAAQHGVPMVWGRVFAGGYGGLVARSRPGLDPTPHEMRKLIDIWCANPEFPEPPAAADIDYGAEADDQPAMIADDGDVTVISAHLARMATDALRPTAETDYPYSAYMIGLRSKWIFTQPYQTFPIDLAESMAKLPREAWATDRHASFAPGGSLAKRISLSPYPKTKWLT